MEKPTFIPSMYLEDVNIEHHVKASYASDAEQSRGRIYQEEQSNNRSYFRRDCDRIIHSTAFRRLEYKTQVFVNHEGDHYRTRLTHSLEVAQIARSISRNLSVNEDLAEACALAHDLGHTPFGHAGEEALNEAAAGVCYFNHNAQSIKILTELEQKYADFDGLNLTWEVLEGIVKHNGPLIGQYAVANKLPAFGIPAVIEKLNQQFGLDLETFPSIEAQIASASDDIAYNNHDIDDGLRAGLFTEENITHLPMVGNLYREVRNRYPDISHDRLVHEANRRMINRMIVDLTRTTLQNIKDFDIKTADDVRKMDRPVVAFSKNMQSNIAEVRNFLKENMYEHYKVARMTSKARRVIHELYDAFAQDVKCLPTQWRIRAEQANSDQGRAEVVMDYIAGMTDRYAYQEYRRMFEIERAV